MDHQRSDEQEFRRGPEDVAEGEPQCSTWRTARKDQGVALDVPRKMTLEQALE